MIDPDGPPTEKQIAVIKKAKKEIPKTKHLASLMIDEIMGNKTRFEYDDTHPLVTTGREMAEALINIRGGVEEACKEAGITNGQEIGALFNKTIDVLIYKTQKFI